MSTFTGRFKHLTLGVILCGSSAFAATFQLVGSDPTPIPITGPVFHFGANGNGGGIFEFLNATGGTLTSLEFVADIPNVGHPPIGCPDAPAPNVYNVSVKNLDNTGFDTSDTTIGCPNDHFVLKIFGTNLPDGTGVFTVNLNDGSTNDDNGKGGWKGAEFTTTVTVADITAVPEPATVGLIGVGLAGLAIWRRRRSF